MAKKMVKVMNDGDEMASDDSDKEEEEDADDDNSPMDPRAGRVDVTIPQLMVDYEKLSDELFSAGSSKQVGQSQRKVLYRLAKQFRALGEGRYPLAPEYNDDGEEVDLQGELPRVDLKKERKKTAGETMERMQEVAEERRKYKADMLARRKGQRQSHQEDAANEEDEEEEKSSDSGVEDQSVSDDEDRVPSMKVNGEVGEGDQGGGEEERKTKV